MNAVLEPIITTRSAGPQHSVASLKEVTKRYSNGVTALNRVSLQLPCGEIVALLGPNGAGKSTAVKLLMGLTAPSAGQVSVFGRDPRSASNRRQTGVMLQVGRAPEMLRVREHVELMRGYYPQPLPFAEIVQAAGLEGLEQRLFGQLSGGQKQRVLFALSICGDPDLIFLDEPSVGLDIEARRSMWAQIRMLRARGKTILLTTHYLEEADALADRIIVLNRGTVICEGTPTQVKAAGAARSGSTISHAGSVEVAAVKVLKFSTQVSCERILSIPGVHSAEESNGILTVASSSPELALRELLALDPNLSGLEIGTPALEEAFLTLTSRH